ncbi:MAG: flagellar basal body-associated protein FliL [Betaproteobacteria bacterium ADurb.Bin341]|nr:MAG: flagellar basal body-associated protein FliL [Betaproteobacteria bacterium ADurb.Bin341]
MAKEQPETETSESPAPQPSRKKKLLIIGIAALLILALAGGATALYFKFFGNTEPGQDEEEVAAAQEEKKKKEEKKKTPPVFAKLDTFTVNLAQETGDQYLQVAITLELEDSLADAALKENMPKIRDSIIRLLGNKKASELTTTEGKDELAWELRDALNLLLEPDQPAPVRGKRRQEIIGPVLAVLFTDFIIQ